MLGEIIRDLFTKKPVSVPQMKKAVSTIKTELLCDMMITQRVADAVEELIEYCQSSIPITEVEKIIRNVNTRLLEAGIEIDDIEIINNEFEKVLRGNKK